MTQNAARIDTTQLLRSVGRVQATVDLPRAAAPGSGRHRPDRRGLGRLAGNGALGVLRRAGRGGRTDHPRQRRRAMDFPAHAFAGLWVAAYTVTRLTFVFPDWNEGLGDPVAVKPVIDVALPADVAPAHQGVRDRPVRRRHQRSRQLRRGDSGDRRAMAAPGAAIRRQRERGSLRLGTGLQRLGEENTSDVIGRPLLLSSSTNGSRSPRLRAITRRM